LLLLVEAFPLLCYAQTTSKEQSASQATAQPNLLSITIVRVKPEMDTAFRNLMRSRTNPALRRGGMKWRDVWQTAQFGDLFEYVIVAPVENFAQYDSPTALERGLGGEASYDAWRQEVGRYLMEARTYAARFRPDLSYETEMTAPPKMGVVNFYHVVPGRSSDFEEILRSDFLPVMRRSQIRGFWVSQTQFGGDANEYMTLALHENYAEIDRGSPPARVLGQERASELFRKLTRENVTRQERTVIRFVPELSFRQSQAAR